MLLGALISSLFAAIGAQQIRTILVGNPEVGNGFSLTSG
jgi:hypothetical protein